MTTSILIAITMRLSPQSPSSNLPVPNIEPSRYFIIDETPGLEPIKKPNLVSIVDARIVGRNAKVLLDTKERGFPYSVEVKSKPSSALEFAVQKLGKGGTRIVSDPETGQFLWIAIRSQRVF